MKDQNEQRKLSEINRPMNEKLFNNLEKQYQALAKVKSESEQIEEMAVDLCHIDSCKHLPQEECNMTTCDHCEAEALYKAGYRKQVEGEWHTISDYGTAKSVECTACNGRFWFMKKGQLNIDRMPYCPKCGAHMKGE